MEFPKGTQRSQPAQTTYRYIIFPGLVFCCPVIVEVNYMCLHNLMVFVHSSINPYYQPSPFRPYINAQWNICCPYAISKCSQRPNGHESDHLSGWSKFISHYIHFWAIISTVSKQWWLWCSRWALDAIAYLYFAFNRTFSFLSSEQPGKFCLFYKFCL